MERYFYKPDFNSPLRCRFGDLCTVVKGSNLGDNIVTIRFIADDYEVQAERSQLVPTVSRK